MLSITHIIGIVATIGLILGIGFLSGRKVNDAKTFATGGNSNSWAVCGVIMVALVGGQATVGTAQLAFSFGISAWWFTIGAGLGTLLLGLCYCRGLRHSGCTTLFEIIRNQYGRKAETLGCVLCLIGIFISIVSQVLASSAMITSITGMRYLPAALLAIAMMAALVVFGGVRSAGVSGIFKLFLLYVSAIGAGVIVLRLTHNFGFVKDSYNNIAELGSIAIINADSGGDVASLIHKQYFNMLARGPLKDIGSCISLMLGVICTQSYAAGIWAARDVRSARRGSVLCGLLVPPIGAACAMVGIYMRAHYVTEAEVQALAAMGQAVPEGFGVIQNSAQAFPKFILNHMPPWLGGIVIGALLINILGAGSGLSLGAATILVRDVYRNLVRRAFSEIKALRTTIVLILLTAVVVSTTFSGSFINDLGFLSLGLRAVAVIVPLSCALYLPGRFTPLGARCSMVSATAALLLAKVLSLPADPIFWGLGVGIVVILLFKNKKTIIN